MALNNNSLHLAPGSIRMPGIRAALVLKAERPNLVQDLPTCVHHSLSSCSPSGHIYPFWLADESIVKHTDSLRLSPRAALGLQQRKIFFSSLCIISYWIRHWLKCLGVLVPGNISRKDTYRSNAYTPFPLADDLKTPDPLNDLLGCLIKAAMPHDNAPEMFSGNAI